MQLDKALSQISEIHAQVLKTEVFRGYRAATMLVTADFIGEPNGIMAVSVDPDTGANPGTPQRLLTLSEDLASCTWDVFPDGSGFVIVRDVEDPPLVNRFEIIVNWFEELQERVPTGRQP